MSLKGTADETLALLETGHFTAPDSRRIELHAEQARAVQGTRLYTPEQANALLASRAPSDAGRPRIEVTGETTQIAARRLVLEEGVEDPALLNFASARNPGGGFVNGAKAQEEDLCRCSGLYPTLLTQRAYYDANRACTSALYTDHLIHSPKVPWFRARSRDQPECLFLSSVLTAPAPNAGVVREREPHAVDDIETTLRRRAGCVLSAAAAHGHRTLLLGAWGCGVFRNDPTQVADAFGAWLESPQFAGAFDRVVFAVYDTSKTQATRAAFEARF
jgi:uncharacterized protein (TIGR02452 family)